MISIAKNAMSAKFYKARKIENLKNAIGHDLNLYRLKK